MSVQLPLALLPVALLPVAQWQRLEKGTRT